MDDLISRAAAIDAIAIEFDECGIEYGPNEVVHRVTCELKNLPAVDAVPVVRCRDCKYWYAEIGASTGWLPCQEIVTDRNWFCASGKRRDGDG